MLYDRLVTPRLPDETENVRWREAKWNPELQGRLLKILGDRAYIVDWDARGRRVGATGTPQGQKSRKPPVTGLSPQPEQS